MKSTQLLLLLLAGKKKKTTATVLAERKELRKICRRHWLDSTGDSTAHWKPTVEVQQWASGTVEGEMGR